MGKKANRAVTQRAIRTLTRSPEFAATDAEMRRLTEPIVRGMARSPPPRLRAIKWFDTSAERYLALVTDRASWDAYRVWLYDLLYPHARAFLFGGEGVFPVSKRAVQLERKLEARLRHWHQKASEALAKRREESKVEDQTSTKSVSASAAIRHQPEVRRWEDIEISFLSDERVEIRIGSQIETRNYAEMGFEDQRTGKPNEAWSLLKGLAELKGEISRDELSGKHLERFTKRIERTRRVLRKHFGMTDDPVPYTQGVGYRARFKIQLAVAYKT